MPKTWKLKEAPENTANLPEYPPLITRLLALRGITEGPEIENFLNPEYELLHDPFLFKDMQKSVERIYKAIEGKEKIVIYADYDADAITAASVMHQALKKLGNTPTTYIPDRFTEGYGMNTEAIRKLAEEKVTLVITVDCGINAVAEADVCKELGLDLIITDHHEVTGPLPQAFAIVNPKNPEDSYPFGFLTGVGVAYKVVQALFSKEHPDIPAGWEKWLLDLVAIGTVADCQSLTGENRVLVSYGLKVLGKTKWPGLQALLELLDIQGQKYDSFTLGFVLGPRINAAGRIKHGDSALNLLVAEDMDKARILAKELNELNTKRQGLTEQVLSEARSQAVMQSDKKVIVVAGQEWPKGVVGLIAGRLTEEYNRASLVISLDKDGMGTGSARSTPELDIVKGLGYSRDLLVRFGGHTQAAGFTVEGSKVEALRGKLLQYAEEINFVLGDASISIDAETVPEDITWETLELIERLAPFGIGNPKPKLCARGLQVVEYRGVSEGKHLKLRLKFGETILEAIAFNQGFQTNKLTPNQQIDVVFELSSNEWNGRKDMQMKVIDIKPCMTN